MPLVKSLLAMNQAYAQIGTPQVQPVIDSNAYSLKTQNVSAVDVNLNFFPIITKTDAGDLKVTKLSSTSNLIKSVLNDPIAVMPIVPSIGGSIVKAFGFGHTDTRPDSTDSAPLSKKHVVPYEHLTGLGVERPEIIAMVDFLPLFDDVKKTVNKSSQLKQTMTDAGEFFDTQISMRSLAKENVRLHLPRLLPYLEGKVREKASTSDVLVNQLRTTTTFLLSLYAELEKAKNALDLRDEIHTVNTENTKLKISWKKSDKNSDPPKKTMLQDKYSLVDALISLGFNPDGARSMYSSTKMWLQLMYELKLILREHSRSLLSMDSSEQANDTSPTTLLEQRAKLFNITNVDVTGLLSLSDLVSIEPPAIAQTVLTISEAYRLLYDNVPFKSDEYKVSAMINAFVKECKYTKGMTSNETARILNENFNYQIADFANEKWFDSVFGQFGHSITDIPATTTKSLASLAFTVPAENVAVLNFESKYIEGSVGTLTPGSVFYIDEVLRTDGKSFNTERLDRLSNNLLVLNRNMLSLFKSMNIVVPSTGQTTKKSGASGINLYDNDELFGWLSKIFVDKSGITLPGVKSDPVIALYAFAAKNPKLKSLLFMYVANRVMRTYGKVVGKKALTQGDNTPMTNAIITQMMNVLASSVKVKTGEKKAAKFVSQVSEPSLIYALKAGTGPSAVIESFFLFVVQKFREPNMLKSDRTRHGGHLDTTMLMLAFDIVVMLAAQLSNQEIIDRHYVSSKTKQMVNMYTVAKSTIDHKNSVTTITSRLSNEEMFTQMLVFAVINTLENLSGTLRKCYNFLHSFENIDQLNVVNDVIKDPNLLQIMLNEQQIFMLASTVDDLAYAYSRTDKQNTPPPGGHSYSDPDKDGDFDSQDEIKIIDELEVTPPYRDVLYGYFKTPEFTTRKAVNKKILSVGIPLGFTNRLKSTVNAVDVVGAKNQNDINQQRVLQLKESQTDIVVLEVYRVDMLNPDIVHKPKQFMFEMSRFPVRNHDMLLGVNEGSSTSEVVSAVPTRDFQQAIDLSDVSDRRISYMPRNGAIPNGFSAALSTKTYDFLTQEQKDDVARNHVISYLLETYIHVMTGVSVAEHHFDLIEPAPLVDQEFVKLVANSAIQFLDATFTKSKVNPEQKADVMFFANTVGKVVQATKSKGGQAQTEKKKEFSAPWGEIKVNYPQGDKKVTLPYEEIFKAVKEKESAEFAQKAATAIKHVNSIKKMYTSFVDHLAASRQLMLPKQFDRVFNIIIEPDDFEIDYDKTMETPHGKTALEQLVKNKSVVEVIDPNISPSTVFGKFGVKVSNQSAFNPGAAQMSPVKKYKFRSRDKSEGDLTFDKYFVVIKSVTRTQ